MIHKNQKRKQSILTKVSNILPVVKDSLGIQDQLKIQFINEIWINIVDVSISRYSKPAFFDREMNLVISVKNSSLATELSMQKISILNKLNTALRNTDISIKDLRFKIGG